MKFQQKILFGKLIRRYKRFLADVTLETSGAQITAHCPDPGSMRTVAEPGRRVLLAYYPESRRKYAYGLELIHNGRCWISVHPGRANQIVREACTQQNHIVQRIPELAGYAEIRPEVLFPVQGANTNPSTGAGRASRFDFLLTGGRRRKPCYLEVKSVTMMRAGDYEFPDAPTERGRRHLRDLMAARAAGYRAVLLFLIQRSDGRRLRMAEDIDPEYARLAFAARRAGVELIAYGTRIRVIKPGPKNIKGELRVTVGRAVPIVFTNRRR